jgi:hypothetical protein
MNNDLTDSARLNLKNTARRRAYYFKNLPEKHKPYAVIAGKYSMILSKGFLIQNNATDNLELIISLFLIKYKLFARMERCTKQESIMKLADKVTQNEFKIQEAFNFARDVKFHRFWEVPKCKCPSMDNQERWGTGRSIYTEDCPIHGKHTWNLED